MCVYLGFLLTGGSEALAKRAQRCIQNWWACVPPQKKNSRKGLILYKLPLLVWGHFCSKFLWDMCIYLYLSWVMYIANGKVFLLEQEVFWEVKEFFFTSCCFLQTELLPRCGEIPPVGQVVHENGKMLLQAVLEVRNGNSGLPSLGQWEGIIDRRAVITFANSALLLQKFPVWLSLTLCKYMLQDSLNKCV